jgi:thiol-disulfide isomerase/thioredoxin
MKRLVPLLVVVAIAGSAHRAAAVPAFARKYKTSCTTCHTIFPKLNPFGEQFRRNGFRFPGIDSDVVKSEPVPLGTDEQKKLFPDAVWPGTLSPFPAFALGFNGQAVFHPDTGSSGGVADNGAVFNTDTLVEEAHLWAAGSLDDSITYFTELTAADGGLELETASLYFNDLVGPAHAVNVAVGKRIGSYTSFQPHGSYFADMMIPQVPVTGLYGATSDPFVFNDNHSGIEVNGVLESRFDYSAGLVAGTNVDTRNSANFYAHVGYKYGGANLDGENTHNVPQDIEHEESVTVDAFVYRSISRFLDAGDPGAMPPVDPALTKDVALTFGGSVRGQLSELELDSGVFYQTDDHVSSTAPNTSTLSQWNEISYLLYPWLAVGGRAEYLRVAQDGVAAVSDLRIVPGVAALVRPNLKLTLTAPIEQAIGAPGAGWGAAGLAAAPADATSKVGVENESVVLQLWTAF